MTRRNMVSRTKTHLVLSVPDCRLQCFLKIGILLQAENIINKQYQQCWTKNRFSSYKNSLFSKKGFMVQFALQALLKSLQTCKSYHFTNRLKKVPGSPKTVITFQTKLSFMDFESQPIVVIRKSKTPRHVGACQSAKLLLTKIGITCFSQGRRGRQPNKAIENCKLSRAIHPSKQSARENKLSKLVVYYHCVSRRRLRTRTKKTKLRHF